VGRAPRVDPVAKLDALPQSFTAVIRTPTLTLYRFRGEPSASR
jgi:hypothetical protein